MNVLFLGDLVGEAIVPFLKKNLPPILKKYNISFVIVNGENLANGYGTTPELCERLFEIGINVISSGNHIWDQEKIFPYIAKQKGLLRPVNDSDTAPGNGFGSFFDKNGKKGKANEHVISKLVDSGSIISRRRFEHQYPHSWRSKKPVIFRNTPQWFISMQDNKKDGLR